MFDAFLFYALPFSFTLLVACALASIVSLAVLVLFRLRETNQALRHPYLDQRPWERYPLSIKAAILLDYFLRLAFPKSGFWIAGQANHLLRHVRPADVPTRIKWPLVGLWAGCFVGLAAMVVLWIIVLITLE
ncbi:hypothetical protein [Parapusillimonas granuli]|uniref:Uncharacterized protein n=1 Tax=Parapusillimonas granuli TaxID=380911 RepID=A0A853G052_9BURK|nr:hypothetical protein [Parapusillimonas granuli]MBB5213602.1 hypothetical protein [Parapusillimonas granuli]MEB2398695.1 hypothetical protein [Alcaligenaceae bacterium]NYT48440.1 hypothetical protein [Parapusillimonas granuli]